MATPGYSSCARCNRAIALDSASGVCEECLRTGGTPGSTSVEAVPAPQVSRTAPAAFAEPPQSGQFLTTRTDLDRTATPAPPDADTKRFALKDGAVLPESPPGYDLLRCLGSGGMGSVYLAHEHATDRRVAIKFLHTPSIGTAFDRFLIEIRALAELRHANIINVLHVDVNRREPFFTMDYAVGGTLADYVRHTGTVEPREAARLVQGAADAIAAAHDKSILHRDVKPSNILLFDSGVPDQFLPRVSDFGLAKRTDRDDDLTRSGPLGTPCYMSPEAAAGRVRELTPAADVYGLGATLFHMLVGRPPFSGDANDEIIKKVLNEDPPRMRTLRPEVPAELEAIVVKCLEKNPAARYSSARELAADLGRFLEGNSVEAPVQTPLRRTQRWLQWHRAGIAMSILGLVVVAGLILLGIMLAPAPQPPVDPQVEYRRDLVAGKPVTLLGAKGLPRHHRWQLGSATLTTAANSDDACSYETINMGLLELLDDPGIDRYRVSLQIRQLERATKITPDDGWCGLFVSHSHAAGADRTSANHFFSVTYSDTLPPPDKDGKIPQQQVRYERVSLFHAPDQQTLRLPSHFASQHFTANPLRPGPWRGFEFEVEANRLRGYWKEFETGERTEIVIPNGKVLAPEQKYKTLPFSADPRIVVPPWSPRMGLGVYTRACAVAIKNITVTPLPPPE